MVAPVQTSAFGAFNGSLTATTTLTGVTAGNHIIVVAMHGDTVGTGPDLSCSDAQGAYSVDVDAAAGGGVARTKLFRLTNANAGTHTISVVASSGAAANSKGAIVALEVPQVMLDKSAIGGASSATPSAGPTAALTGTGELVIAGLFHVNMSVGGGTFPPTGGTGAYTSLGIAHSNQADAAYQTLSSAAAVSASWGTLSASGRWTALVGVYQAVGSPEALLSWPKQTFVNQTIIQF